VGSLLFTHFDEIGDPTYAGPDDSSLQMEERNQVPS